MKLHKKGFNSLRPESFYRKSVSGSVSKKRGSMAAREPEVTAQRHPTLNGGLADMTQRALLGEAPQSRA